jgi:hypothetical protein
VYAVPEIPETRPNASVQLEASSEEGSEADIELGEVDSSAEANFGCHIFLDLKAFSIDGKNIGSPHFAATQIRFHVPWDPDKPDGDIEQLDGFVFDKAKLVPTTRLELHHEGTNGVPKTLAIDLDKFTLKRLDNWHFEIDLRGKLDFPKANGTSIHLKAPLEIEWLHWPPVGTPEAMVIDLAKNLIGEPKLPSRVIASIGDSRVYIDSGETIEDKQVLILFFRDQEFKEWIQAVKAGHEMTSTPPGELVSMPDDWKGQSRGRRCASTRQRDHSRA